MTYGWPAAMRLKSAASYCELSVADFEREISAGRLPMPVKLGSHEHWSKAKIDEALERIAGSSHDWRAAVGLNHAA